MRKGRVEGRPRGRTWAMRMHVPKAMATAKESRVAGLVLREHTVKVPLDHLGQKNDQHIDVFVREVEEANGKASQGSSHDKPCLLFLQGGPGFECARPLETGGWIGEAVKEFRVMLMDQRGTGRSAPISTTSLQRLGSPKQQAEYLKHFRADSIVRDAEAVRREIVGKDTQWTIMGQSFGGFCVLSYLSYFPQGVREALITGGIPPLWEGCSAEQVYRKLFPRVKLQNEKFYQRYPEDVDKVRKIVQHLHDHKASTGDWPALPSGTKLSPRMFQLLGLSAVGNHTGFERLHYLVESAWDGPPFQDGEQLSPTFLREAENSLHFDTNPLYALLHESAYCNGPGQAAMWAAQRVREEEFADDFPELMEGLTSDRPVYFTGEMVFPWMFEEMVYLRASKEAAQLLAQETSWSKLYDVGMLKQNRVPVASATYYEDVYVDFDLSMESVGSIHGIRPWVTNEYMHSGVREDGPRILERLLSLVRDTRPRR